MSTITPTQQPNCTAATGALSLNGKKCAPSAENGTTASAIHVSGVKSAKDTKTRDHDAKEIVEFIRTDEPLKYLPIKLRLRIERIRSNFAAVLTKTGDRKAAKNAINEEKKQLPAVMFSGRFGSRNKNALIEHSGLLCADLDELGDRLPEVRVKLRESPHLFWRCESLIAA